MGRVLISKVSRKYRSWIRALQPRAIRRILRQRSNQRVITATLVVILLALPAAGLIYNYTMHSDINPTAYTPLLNTIAKGESNGNYNAYYGHSANTEVRFTNMTVAEVMQWQESYVKQGSPSSAVGKYQIVRPTLAGLVKQLKLDTRTRFDERLQDRLAITLLERRGSKAYVEKKLTREQFAANIAKEWAALPKIEGANPEQSYYAGDGINAAHIRIDEVYAALTPLRS
jgi:muramidase (phage lysozyme)